MEAQLVNPYEFHNCNIVTWNYTEKNLIEAILKCSATVCSIKIKSDTLRNFYKHKKYETLIQILEQSKKECELVIDKADDTVQLTDSKAPNTNLNSLNIVYNSISSLLLEILAVMQSIETKFNKNTLYILESHVI